MEATEPRTTVAGADSDLRVAPGRWRQRHRVRDGWQGAVDGEAMQTVSLSRPLPVLILYLTAVAFDEGRDFTFLRDIYDRDGAVLRALNAGFVYSPPAGLQPAAVVNPG